MKGLVHISDRALIYILCTVSCRKVRGCANELCICARCMVLLLQFKGCVNIQLYNSLMPKTTVQNHLVTETEAWVQ